MRPTVQGFLLRLRGVDPPLARRLDGVVGLGWDGATLTARVPKGSWALAEAGRLRGRLARAVRDHFGRTARLRLDPTRPAPERLPFSVLASKVWNHVGFWVWDADRFGVLAVPKPLYLDGWLPAAAAGGDAAVATEGEGVRWVWGPVPPSRPEDAPAAFLDPLAALCRERRSYTQFVTPFPGDPVADRLESRLAAVRDWGTPTTPGPVLTRYTGRLHYVSPSRPVLGVRLARRRLAAG